MAKEAPKKWNEEVFGDIKIQKYNMMDSVSSLDVKEEAFGLCNGELEQRKVSRDEVAKVIFPISHD